MFSSRVIGLLLNLLAKDRSRGVGILGSDVDFAEVLERCQIVTLIGVAGTVDAIDSFGCGFI